MSVVIFRLSVVGSRMMAAGGTGYGEWPDHPGPRSEQPWGSAPQQSIQSVVGGEGEAVGEDGARHGNGGGEVVAG